MKIINNIKYLVFTLIISLICIINVNAATGKITLSASSTSVAVGSTTKVTITCSSTSTLGGCEYKLNYDSSILKITSGDSAQAWWNQSVSESTKTQSFTVTFKAIGAGTSKISLSGVDLIDINANSLSTSTNSISIKGYIPNTTSDTSSSSSTTNYSTNNDLKSLTVSSGELSPKFSKDKTEYTLNLDSTTTKLTVKATPEDSKSSVTGAKEYNLSLGTNKIEVIVTSEKGTKKTYKITVNVEDKNPIEVSLNNKKYTVIKQKELLTMPNNYTLKEVTINDTIVPGFYSETLGFTLVGLKDEDSNIDLYIYDEENNKYSKYIEYNFSSIKIVPLETNEELKGYIKVNTTINNNEIVGYKLNKSSKYTIIYALNIETLEKGWYSYEETENTIQKFSYDIMDALLDNNTKSDEIIKILMCVILILALLIIIVSTTKTKKRSKKKINKDLNEIKDKNINKNLKETKDKDIKEEKTNKKKKEKKKKDTKILDEW